MKQRLCMTWVIAAVMAVGVLAAVSVASGADVVRVGDMYVPLLKTRSSRSTVVETVAPATELEVLYRDGDWIWVMTPPGKDGRARTGWINRRQLVDATRASGEPTEGSAAPSTTEAVSVVVTRPSVSDLAAAAEEARTARNAARHSETGSASVLASVATKNVRASTATSGRPPDPVGGVTKQGGSVIGEWIVPRGLRAAVGVNYQSTDVSQVAGSMSNRLLGGAATVSASFAVLDPRIVTVDFVGDFQANRATSDASLSSFRDTSGLQSYRLDLGILSGRKAPMRLYADRVSSTSDLQPFGVTVESPRRTRGLRTDAGFTWSLDPDPALPHIELTASKGRQIDERNYLFGTSSVNEETRAELRASRDYRLGRYDLHFTHGLFAYDVPDAGLRSDNSSDVFLATGRLTPSSRLTFDLHARGTRFTFAAGSQKSTVTGAGGDAAVRYQFSRRLAASGSYSFSNNAFEAMLSGRLTPGAPGATPVTSEAQLSTRTFYNDGEGRVEYATKPLVAAAVVKEVTFDVPPVMPQTLSATRTAGPLLRVQHTSHGLTLGAGADGEFGSAQSNRGVVEPYREMGVEAGLSQEIGHAARFGVDGSVRRVGRLTFFPVNLDATAATLRFETMRPGWARLRGSVTRFDNLRDVLITDARDRHIGYSAGLSGPWYDLSADINQTDTNSRLLSPAVLGSRPEVAVLIASRPELFRNLLAARDRSRVFGVQVRPVPGLQLQARARDQQQVYPGLFGFRVKGGQAWASYQLRELQLEVGWEYFDSVTSFGNVVDRRLYFRIRRDLFFF